ncbi:uncharacterized protein AMSG_03262 [Thecamonas trahens ATCC 50062]|uniref:RFX-type winged-helix domain-containing protein n=1 Tax=Thecamonas trahens ATCC 50062 TaxID=461836 RepID=A0A0L0D411_THETB|nr:hypothetical protein AMSG_03262 [Thecamonas trahens ATCC 50062]KNC46831.1 hypothetical protein AMSG_03262 [Thecamonas trahens ATCC 50062]|eukprot:XP_013760106.1 hypothetical protein AMSG_03262 [Thecamonas trahens ATCC 50062]
MTTPAALFRAWLVVVAADANQSATLERATVFDAFASYAAAHGYDDLPVAVAGRVIRAAFPRVGTRRLGARGKSKHHYTGIAWRDGFPAASDLPPPDDLLDMCRKTASHAPAPPAAHADRVVDTGGSSWFPELVAAAADVEAGEASLVDAIVTVRTSGQLGGLAAIIEAELRRRNEMWASLAPGADVAEAMQAAEERVLAKLLSALIPDVTDPELATALAVLGPAVDAITAAMRAATLPASGSSSSDPVAGFDAAARRQIALVTQAATVATTIADEPLMARLDALLTAVDWAQISQMCMWCLAMPDTAVRAFATATVDLVAQRAPLAAWAETTAEFVGSIGPVNFTDASRRFVSSWVFFTDSVIREASLLPDAAREADAVNALAALLRLATEYVLYAIEYRSAMEARSESQKRPRGVSSNASSDSDSDDKTEDDKGGAAYNSVPNDNSEPLPPPSSKRARRVHQSNGSQSRDSYGSDDDHQQERAKRARHH